MALRIMALPAYPYQGKERKQKELIAGLEETFFKVMRTHNPNTRIHRTRTRTRTRTRIPEPEPYSSR
jgi:hypothetical protein